MKIRLIWNDSGMFVIVSRMMKFFFGWGGGGGQIVQSSVDKTRIGSLDVMEYKSWMEMASSLVKKIVCTKHDHHMKVKYFGSKEGNIRNQRKMSFLLCVNMPHNVKSITYISSPKLKADVQ